MLVTMSLNSHCCYSKVVVTLLFTCYGNLKYFKFSILVIMALVMMLLQQNSRKFVILLLW
jgi:hypothetical protein